MKVVIYEELMKALTRELESRSHGDPDEAILRIMDRLEGWCAPKQRIRVYEIEDSDFWPL